MVRMGVRVTVALDRPSLGRNVATYSVVAIDAEGNETSYLEEESEEDGLAFDVVHFVELEDGRRVAAEGEATLYAPDEITREELEDDVREMVFEEELAELDEDEAHWEDLIEALARAGVVTDEAALEALPFVIELDESVTAHLG